MFTDAKSYVNYMIFNEKLDENEVALYEMALEEAGRDASIQLFLMVLNSHRKMNLMFV